MHAIKLLNIYWISIANLALSSPVTTAEKKIAVKQVYSSYKTKESWLFRIQIFSQRHSMSRSWWVTQWTRTSVHPKSSYHVTLLQDCPSMKIDIRTNTKGQCSKTGSNRVTSGQPKNMALWWSGWTQRCRLSEEWKSCSTFWQCSTNIIYHHQAFE